MMNTRHKMLVTATVSLAAVTGTALAVGSASDRDRSAKLAGQINPSKPKNVILLVGDGMGDSEVTSGRYYGKGAARAAEHGQLPVPRLARSTTSSPQARAPTTCPNYAGDSAPTATAWSTGKKTIDGRLSQGPSADPKIPGDNAGYETYLEIARDRGKATGNVSTAEITDATPAGPSSHISQRACQGPADTRTTCKTETKASGGLGSIAEQQVDEGFDLYLGGGRDRYLQTTDAGPTVVDYAESKGYDVVGTKAELNALTPGTKAIGLFNASNMTTRFAPLYARTDAFLSQPGVDPQVNGGSPTTRCQPQRRGTEPDLVEMTRKALELLSADPDGFALQVEGASIDKRDHAADACGQIGELLGFDNAVRVALNYQKAHPDTLVIMTADHAHTSQIINAAAKPAAGTSYATLETVDGAPIRIAYGTADTGTDPAKTAGSQAHTGAEVPVWASGPQAANIQGTIDQTDIFGVLNGKVPSS